MGMDTRGRLYHIYDAQQVSERFRKREFVLELDADGRYPQYVIFQLTGDRTEALEGFSVGDPVRVEFSLRGREWKSPKGETRFFNSLDVWTIEHEGARARGGVDDLPPFLDAPAPQDDDIPF